MTEPDRIQSLRENIRTYEEALAGLESKRKSMQERRRGEGAGAMA